jgi:trypsin
MKKIEAEPRIVGGTITKEDTYQFFVRIDHSGFTYCGGNLVAPDVVLTAAHCFANADDLSVMVNGYSLSEELEDGQYGSDVESLLQHPNFDSATYENDVMLLKLQSPVFEVNCVSLNFNDANPQNGDQLTVLGLGNTAEDGSASNYLREVNMNVVDQEVCLANYQEIGLGRIREDIMLCAGALGEGGRDACQGDSGGPLIDKDAKLIGVISWGVGCGQKDFPGVYARVSGLQGWLGDNICSMSSY